MARMKEKNPNTPSPTYPVEQSNPPQMFSPEWFDQHKEEMAAAGFQFVKKEDFDQMTRKETRQAAAAKDLLGIDFENRDKIQEGDARLRFLDELVPKVRDQLDLVMQSAQFRSKTTQKEQIAIHAVRVFIRQLLNEPAPPGQAATLRELIGIHAGIPDGVLNDRGKPRPAPQKVIHLTPEHLEQAGIT